MEQENNRPKVGLGVMIKNNEEKVLLGLRKSPHGNGTWCFPGGHLEFGETMTQAVKREAAEETGLDVDDFTLVSVADELGAIEKGKHYINIGFCANKVSGELKTKEPEKFERWEWFDLNDLPTPLFEGTELMINRYKEGKIYF